MTKNKGLTVFGDKMPTIGSMFSEILNEEFTISRFDKMFKEINKIIDAVWSNGRYSNDFFATLSYPKSQVPKVNIREDENKYNIEIAVAGFSKDDVELELKDNSLFIKAEQSVDNDGETADEDKGSYVVREISSRSFRRCIRFPEKIDINVVDDVDVSFKDGLLKFELPKLGKTDDSVKLKIN